jgi:hypothetical protein
MSPLELIIKTLNDLTPIVASEKTIAQHAKALAAAKELNEQSMKPVAYSYVWNGMTVITDGPDNIARAKNLKCKLTPLYASPKSSDL